MPAQNPVISSVRCAENSGNYTVTITWTPIQGTTYFYAGIFNPQNQSVNHLVVDSRRRSYVANIRNISLDPGTAYTVKVAQCDVNGNLTSAYSMPWNLLQNPLANLTLYNNLTNIAVSAILPTAGAATGIEATLVDANYDQLANGQIKGESGSIPLDNPLDQTQTYTLYVNPIANGGVNQGPSSHISLVMTNVQIGKVTYDGNNMAVFAVTPPPDTLAGWLMAGDDIITSNTGSSASVSLTQTWTDLNLAQTYTASLRALNGSSYGPSSKAVPVVVAPPDLVDAFYAGERAGVAWNVPPVLPEPTGGQVAVVADGGVAGSPADVLGYKGSIDMSSVHPATSLSVQVNSKYGVAYGPPSSVNIPFAAPAISSVSVISGCVKVAWNALAGVPGYRVSLNDANGKPVKTLETTDIHAAISAALDGAAGYKVSVQVYGKDNDILLTGPASPEVAAISAIPVISKVTCDGSKVTVTWNPVANTAGITGYTAALLDPETLNPTSHTASVTGVTATTVDITATLDTSKRYLAAVTAIGAATEGMQGNAVEVVNTAPVITSVANDGTHCVFSWETMEDPILTGYQIAYKDGGTDKTAATGKTSYALPSASTDITVSAQSSLGLGPATAVPANALAAPAISSVRVAEGDINVSWPAVTGAPGYRVSLNDANGKPIQTLETTDTHAAMSAALDGATGYKVSVQAYGTDNDILFTGPDSAQVAAISAIPVISKVTCDGSKVTVTWNPVTNTAGITSYTATLLDPETLNPTSYTASVSGVTATTVDITAALDTSRRYLATVAATGETAEGKQGMTVEVIHVAPVITAYDISAASVSIEWTASPCPSASGYVVRLSDNAATPKVKTILTEDTAISFTNDLTPAQVYASVSARGTLATGPDSPQVNLFGTSDSFYSLPVSTSDTTPYLIRSSANQPVPADITFAFPDIFTSAPSSLPDAGTFKLEANTASTAYPYKMTVTAGSDAWKFDTASRTNLAGDFTDFIKKMEMPDGTNVRIKGGALAMVRQSIALGLPLLYSEIPYYMYAFNPSNQTGGYVDLVPGMRLRVDSESYQTTPPNNNQAGYVTNASTAYEIHAYVDGQTSDPNTGFDAFLSAMQRTTVPTPLASVNGGGAGIIDLYTSGGRLPYFRLLYPGALRDPKYTGLVSQTDLPVILGAANYNTLVAATAQYINSGNFTGLTGVFPFYFRGRNMPVPEIAVRLNGERHWVPVGTTVANLLETEGAIPQLVSATISGFAMERSIGGLTGNTTAQGKGTTMMITTNRVRLEYAQSTFTPAQPGVFGLPLLLGDRITLG